MVVIAVVGTIKTVGTATKISQTKQRLQGLLWMTLWECPAKQTNLLGNQAIKLDLRHGITMEKVNLDLPIAMVDPVLQCVRTTVIIHPKIRT